MQLITHSPVIHESGDMSATAKQTSVDRRRSGPKSACGLLVGKAEQIDGHDRVSIYTGHGGDRGDHAARLNRCGDVERGGWIHTEHRHDRGTSRGDPATRGVRVAERLEQVGQIVPAAQHPWAREDTRKGLLDQILGLVVRGAQRARDSVQNGPMRDKGPRVEIARLA
jgi:hypothetical protein